MRDLLLLLREYKRRLPRGCLLLLLMIRLLRFDFLFEYSLLRGWGGHLFKYSLLRGWGGRLFRYSLLRGYRGHLFKYSSMSRDIKLGSIVSAFICFLYYDYGYSAKIC